MAKYEPHDKFYRKARERGLASRAAFKIEELIARYRLVRRGARVAALGCAPGGWLAMLAAAAGAEGRVAGVDIAVCKIAMPGVVTITADIRDAATIARITDALGGKADLVTSDLAPRLTGIADRDQARMVELVKAAIGCARAVLRPGGAMVAKLFMGGDFDALAAKFKGEFERVEMTRTRATRPGSSELYVIARGFRAAALSEPGGE